MRKQGRVTLHFLNEVTGKTKLNIGLLLFLQVFLGMTGVALAWLMRGIIDCAVAKELHGFLMYTAAMVLLVVCHMLFQAGNRFLEEHTRSTLENSLKDRLFSVLLSRDYASVSAVHSGEWMNRLTSDTVVVADGLTQILPGVAGMLVRMAGALVMLLVLVSSLSWLILVGGAFLLGITMIVRRRLKKLHKQVQEADGSLRVYLQERLGSLLMIHAYGCEKRIEKEASDRMTEHKKSRMKRNRFSNICNIGFGSAMNFAYVLGAVYCGYGILQGSMTYGTFTAVLQLIGQIQSPFASITGYLPRFYACLASAERLMEAECFAKETEGRMEQGEVNRFYEEELAGVEFSEVSFAYRNHDRKYCEDAEQIRPETLEKSGIQEAVIDQVVLDHISIQMKKGEYIAITGPSGCGKSTLLKLLLCVYPVTDGEMLLVTKTGAIPLTSAYRSLFAYVPQGNQLMSGTIREVVAFEEPERMRDEELLWKSLSIACADGFVRNLPMGLDSMLGERGCGLSEGQMQRIAIARAICSGNPILLLDEATSALDEDTERQLLANLRAQTNRTVLIVTHRPAAFAICDRKVSILNGKITSGEEGQL